MQKRLVILGSTGSVGTQALEVIAAHPEQFKIVALVAFHNDKLLETQLDRFRPDLAVLIDPAAAARLKSRYHGPAKLLAGQEGLLAAATFAAADTVFNSLVGFAGLKPTLAAIDAGKNILLANKETLVAAGEIVTRAAKEKGVSIVPVDSEHSAILQSLQGERRANIAKIILTASGGPFFGWTASQLQQVSVEACLRHPNWSMGKKITVDSATLANKGLEVIEARWLFDVTYDQIEVVIHPQSIIHSMVEFSDGAVIAQLGPTDMRIPIQYALTYPDRRPSEFPRLNFRALNALTFAAPDTEVFPALTLAVAAGRAGGTAPCAFNAANEVAVHAFLAGKITFLDIIRIVQHTMVNYQVVPASSLADLCAADEWARTFAAQVIRDSK
jgi:1-deoxy-D-xylulose-5-phosphate reductoisomerase